MESIGPYVAHKETYIALLVNTLPSKLNLIKAKRKHAGDHRLNYPKNLDFKFVLFQIY
jgi:hypothetical protein